MSYHENHWKKILELENLFDRQKKDLFSLMNLINKFKIHYYKEDAEQKNEKIGILICKTHSSLEESYDILEYHTEMSIFHLNYTQTLLQYFQKELYSSLLIIIRNSNEEQIQIIKEKDLKKN